MTTRGDIREWLAASKARGATHMLVVCDTYDYEDYPVDVMPGQDVRKMAANPGEMQRVMEVYSHALDHEGQIYEQRAFHFGDE